MKEHQPCLISHTCTIFTARCTILQSAVLRSHVATVRPSVRLRRWWIEITQVGNLGN